MVALPSRLVFCRAGCAWRSARFLLGNCGIEGSQECAWERSACGKLGQGPAAFRRQSRHSLAAAYVGSRHRGRTVVGPGGLLARHQTDLSRAASAAALGLYLLL